MHAVPLDQATDLRRLVAAERVVQPVTRAASAPLTRCARVIAVASGKGGVGKTNIAVNLSMALARRGRRVVLVDADLGTANVDVLLNLKAPHDLTHLLRGQRSLDEIAVYLEPGLRIILGASGLPGAADLNAAQRHTLLDRLSALETTADVIVLDCGAGISQNVLAFARAADELLVVTTPEPTALTDAYALVKVLCRSQGGPRIRSVINQVRTLREGAAIAERVASVAARFLRVSIGVAGSVLHDDHVALAVRQRSTFIDRYPRCQASACISALAAVVDEPLAQASPRAGFFRRMMRHFY